MTPFDYSPQPHVRAHGPQGYAAYPRFLPWLRDEFSFRCVYCLAREQWISRLGGFAIEHFTPVSRDPLLTTQYDNLLYACSACNLAKGVQSVPDPTQTLVGAAVVVHDDGRIEGHTPMRDESLASWLSMIRASFGFVRTGLRFSNSPSDTNRHSISNF